MDNFSKEEFLYLAKIIDNGEKSKIKNFVRVKHYQDLHNLLSYLSREQRVIFFGSLPYRTSASILSSSPDTKEIYRILVKLKRKHSATLLNYFSSDLQVDILKCFNLHVAQEIIGYLPSRIKKTVSAAIAFADDIAGGLMIREYLKYNIKGTVNDIRKDLEKYAESYKNYNVQYTYIVDEYDNLQGIIPIRSLLLTPSQTPLRKLIKKDIISIAVDTKIEQIKNYFKEYNFIAFPVLDQKKKLSGVITRASVDHFLQKETAQEVLKLTGILGGEEFRSQPIYQRSAKRLSWLVINILLNFLAASVIIAYEDTLAQAITLAVFLPIVSDMSGCSGNQSVAVTLREISLGLISPREILKVLSKEVIVGCINGLILGGILALIAILWKGNLYLGFVVGVSLALNTVIAVCLGSAIPIILKFFKIDPAIASSPILTTLTDIMGFFFIFALASRVLRYIS